jgi:hypothetical protein
MATKDDVKQMLPAETVEFMRQMKAMFTDEAEEERKKEERDLRAIARAQKAAQQALNAKQERDRLTSAAAIKAACTHQRQDGSWNLQGQRSCDGVIRFMCPLCRGQFAPGDPSYETLLKYINRERLGNARQQI